MADTTAATTSTLEHIDPHSLVIEDNIREAVTLEPGFVASIREHGVLQPVLAIRNPDGTLTVRDGQRRTLAARATDTATIPAYVVDAGDDATVRIIQQIITNDQREAITETERVQAFQQLALAGLSADTIATRTGHSPDRVHKSITVAASAAARAAIATGAVTLDAALVLAEFDGDDTAVQYLTEVAAEDPEQLTHAAQYYRDKHATDALITVTAATLTGQGIRVVTEDEDYTPLSALTDTDDTDGPRLGLDEDTHTGCDGHAVVVTAWRGATEATVKPVCTRPDQHSPRWPATGTGTGKVAGGPMSEEQKAERRQVIENNKAWDSAEVVRRDWLTTLLTRKTLPKDALRYSAQVTAAHGDRFDSKARDLAHTLFNLDKPHRFSGNALPHLIDTTPTKAGHVLLALALTAIEATTGRHTWRTPSAGDQAYFRQIAAWGYTLSPVERIVAGTLDPASTE